MVVRPSIRAERSVLILPLLLIAEFPKVKEKSRPVLPIESPLGLLVKLGSELRRVENLKSTV